VLLDCMAFRSSTCTLSPSGASLTSSSVAMDTSSEQTLAVSGTDEVSSSTAAAAALLLGVVRVASRCSGRVRDGGVCAWRCCH
jgi:hypothetical protein